MKFIEYFEKLETIKYMAEHCRTGSPRQLATRLNVSERTIERMIRQLRDRGHAIVFDRFRNSYVLREQEDEVISWFILASPLTRPLPISIIWIWLYKYLIMKFSEYSVKLEELKAAIAENNTGSPSQLAARLQLTERTLIRMVQQLRDHGYPVYFNRKRNSYQKKSG